VDGGLRESRVFEVGQMLEVVRSIPLVEWFADHYQETCGSMEIVTDKSQEGAQFVQGFGGVGGIRPRGIMFPLLEVTFATAILRYKVDLQEMNPLEEFDELAEYEDYL
jgi:peptide chain release factor subunit 1